MTAAEAGAFDAVEIGTAIQRRIGVKTSRDEPLARFTTMRVGGPADLFATVHNVHELRAIVRFARSRAIPLTLLGRGSDVVIADAGVRGLVVQNRAEGSRIDAEGARYTAESGVPMARAATETQKAGLSGLEFGLAIPGTVGGAVWANAGAHENDVAAIIETADVLLDDGTEARLAATDLDLRYRDSRFKAAPGEVVLNASFRLEAADPPTIASRLDEIRKWRREHQPLGIPSAGSAFRNPPGDSAGRLIDEAGLKGYRVGGAAISEKHANFIVNDAKGTAADVRAVLDKVGEEVLRRSGIELQPEIVFLGDWGERGLTAAGAGSAAVPVVVLLGGPSAEHDVSVVSGTAIAEALAGAGHPVTQILIDLSGRWWRLPADHRRDGRAASVYDDPPALGANGPHSAGQAIDGIAALTPEPVVFIALHGPFGEDGTVQALLEAAGLAYTGSGVAASAIGMDKAIFKRITRGVGLPVVDWIEVRAARWEADRAAVIGQLDAFAAGTGDPRLMVKPSRLGSSVGMTLAHGPDEYGPALEEAFRYDTIALAEVYLEGARDLEVSVVGNDHGRLELFGPGEIVAGNEFYDYAAKYTPGLSETSTSAEVDAATKAAILKISRDAYRAIGAEGFARIDFLLHGADVYLSEINTIPGFTPISLFPTLPAAGGYTFADVCEKVVALAQERHAARVGGAISPSDLPR